MNSPWISLPADTPTKKSLRNQIGPGRYHGFLRYVPLCIISLILTLESGEANAHFAFIAWLFSNSYVPN